MFRTSAPLFQAGAKSAATKTTVLENGLKVVTTDNGGRLTSMGLFIDAGARHETGVVGASAILPRLATFSTFNRSSVRMVYDAENLCSNFKVARGRELTTITADTLRPFAENLPGFLLDAARPRCIEYEIRFAQEQFQKDTDAALSNTDTFLCDELHGAAFRGNQLGNSLYARGNLSQADVVEYLFSNWKPENSTFAAINVEHDMVVDLVRNDSFFKNHIEGFDQSRPDAAPKYVGGERGHVSGSETNHIKVGFHGLARDQGGSDVQAVAARLLGAKLESWSALSHTYSDSGLVSFSTSTTNPEEALTQLGSLKGASFSQSEVDDAKRAVEVLNLTNSCALTDLVYGVPDVSGVTVDQVNSAVNTILKSNISLAAQGNLRNVPSPNCIKNLF